MDHRKHREAYEAALASHRTPYAPGQRHVGTPEDREASCRYPGHEDRMAALAARAAAGVELFPGRRPRDDEFGAAGMEGLQ